MPRFVIPILLLSCFALAACGQGVSELMDEGNQYMKDGNHQGAIVIYKTVLESAPETMEARLGLAKAYLGVGKVNQAEKNFEKYLRQNPYDKSVLLDLAKLSAFRKKNQAAIDYLKSYVEEYPDSAEAYELLGKNYWILGENDNSQASLEKAVELDKKGTTAMFSLSQFYAFKGDTKTASKIIDDILAKDPDQTDALHYLAKEELVEGKIEAYRKTLKTILKVNPSDVYAKYMLGKSFLTPEKYSKAVKIAADLTMEAPKTGYGQKLKGIIHYSKKEYKEAIDALLEALSIRPDLESYLHLGLSQYGAGDMETAISNLRIAADRAPKMVKAREMISLILFQQKRYNESIAEAEKVLEVEPDNVIARTIQGDAYSALGEDDKALDQLKTIVEKNPTYADVFMKMGALYYAKGDMTESEKALMGAMNAAPDSVHPRLVLSSFYLRRGDKPLARKVLKQGLTGGKADVALYNSLARIDLMERRPEKAKESLIKAKEADGSNPAPYMMQASIFLAEKKPEAALNEYDAILSKRPDFTQALLGKAVILDTLQRHDAADAVYEEAIKYNHPKAFMAYAGSKRKKRDAEGALAVLEQGLVANANNSELLKAKAEALFALKRFDDVLTMSDEIKSLNRVAGLSLRVQTFMYMKDFEKAIVTARQICDFEPKNPQGYLILADVYMRTKRTKEWGETLEEGVSKCGPNATLLMELSKYFALEGDYSKALTYLDSVIRSNPKMFRAHSIQGDVYNTVGRVSKAVESYNKALELNNNYVPALNNLAMIYLDDPKTASEALRLAYKAYLQVPWSATVMDTFGYALAVNDKKDAAVSILQKAVAIEGGNPTINYHLGYAYYKAGKNEQAVALLKPVADCADCDDSKDARMLLKKIK